MNALNLMKSSSSFPENAENDLKAVDGMDMSPAYFCTPQLARPFSQSGEMHQSQTQLTIDHNLLNTHSSSYLLPVSRQHGLRNDSQRPSRGSITVANITSSKSNQL